MSKKISGTKEWSTDSANCVLGCSHDCRYCYARCHAERFHWVKKGEWSIEQIQTKKLGQKYGKKKGTVMFPTQHDITPLNQTACLQMLLNILKSGNNVLIVSKPHLDVIKKLCEALIEYRAQIMFRFTIGAMDNDVLKYWEPNAPSYEERLRALEWAHMCGFKTSISMEPLLDADHVVEMFKAFAPSVTDSIWIGKLNKIRQRVIIKTAEDEERVKAVEAGQTDERIRKIYEALKDEPLVRWKESYKSVLGLDLAAEPGLDV